MNEHVETKATIAGLNRFVLSMSLFSFEIIQSFT